MISRFLCASTLVLLAAGIGIADPLPRLTNDDLCGTSLLGDEGSQGRSDEAWNERLEEYFRGGGGLALRQGKIEDAGPPADVAIDWLGPKPAPVDPERGGWNAFEHLSVARFEIEGVTVVETRIEHSPSASTAVFVWFTRGRAQSPLEGAAVLVSNDFVTDDDNGYIVWSWSNQSSGSATLERPRWPWSGGPRLALDVTYKSSRVGIAGSLRALVALDRIPEGDPSRIGRFLRDAGIVRAPCLHQNLDPDELEGARKAMERAEASAVIRAAADFVAFDAAHVASHESGPPVEAEVRCPGGRPIAWIALYSDSAGRARRLTSKLTRTQSVDDVEYSYDTEGRLRFVHVRSVRRDSGATAVLRIWYDETGREAGSERTAPVVPPRPGLDPSAEVAWVRGHETELRSVCEPGW